MTGRRGINFSYTGGVTVERTANRCILLLGPSAVVNRRILHRYISFLSTRPRTKTANITVRGSSKAFT